MTEAELEKKLDTISKDIGFLKGKVNDIWLSSMLLYWMLVFALLLILPLVLYFYGSR